MNFKELRDYVGYLQGEPISMRQLSLLAGANDNAFQLWESGKNQPSLKSIISLCKAFNVSFHIEQDGQFYFEK